MTFGPDEFFRLGEPGSYATDEATPAFLGTHVEVTPDGLVWALDEQAGRCGRSARVRGPSARRA